MENIHEAVEATTREPQQILFWGEQRENTIGPLAITITSAGPGIATTL